MKRNMLTQRRTTQTETIQHGTRWKGIQSNNIV